MNESWREREREREKRNQKSEQSNAQAYSRPWKLFIERRSLGSGTTLPGIVNICKHCRTG